MLLKPHSSFFTKALYLLEPTLRAGDMEVGLRLGETAMRAESGTHRYQPKW